MNNNPKWLNDTLRTGDKSKAHMWAAARIIGLEVHGYEPDPYALETHQNMKKKYKETRP